MNQSLIKNENYIMIEGWMVNELKLSGNELIIYALIYGFSQVQGHSFHGSLQYICDWTNISKTSCIKNLKKLIDKKLIIKNEKEINGVKFCEYYISKLHSMQESYMGMQESYTNNIDNNIVSNIDNKLSILDNGELPKEDNLLLKNCKYIIQYLNETANTKYRDNNKNTINLIKARFKDGYTIDDFYDVIDKKWKDWKGTDFEQYMRPQTLFGNKFENYLNGKVFSGKVKSSYSTKPSFDNTINHDIPKGISDMNQEELNQFKESLAKDKAGNLIKF